MIAALHVALLAAAACTAAINRYCSKSHVNVISVSFSAQNIHGSQLVGQSARSARSVCRVAAAGASYCAAGWPVVLMHTMNGTVSPAYARRAVAGVVRRA